MKKELAVLLLAALGLNCTGAVRVNGTFMQRDKQTYHGFRTELEKGDFRYGIGVDVGESKTSSEPRRKSLDIPTVGDIPYTTRSESFPINIVPELNYKLLKFDDLEVRIGGGVELQIIRQTSVYDIPDLHFNFDMSSLGFNTNFFGQGSLSLDVDILNLYGALRMDEKGEYGLIGGIGLKW